ncbi:hypothetical protein KAT92_03100 [Candidatus Babeliales bacterium]|nr:hypothetical protein [Candidatus Babeliales bacterium]
MGEQISLSLELIYLMDWLLKYRAGKLRLLVQEAVENGVALGVPNLSDGEYAQELDQLNDVAIKFIFSLEDMLIKELKKDGNRERFAPLLERWEPTNNEPVN